MAAASDAQRDAELCAVSLIDEVRFNIPQDRVSNKAHGIRQVVLLPICGLTEGCLNLDVYRKPATAHWSHESAQKVDTKEFAKEPWVDQVYLSFDGTKDKAGDRHTTMRIKLTEADVERLYHGLIQGRKSKLRELERERRNSNDDITRLVEMVKDSMNNLESAWTDAGAGTVEESVLSGLRIRLREAIEKICKDRKWVRARF